MRSTGRFTPDPDAEDSAQGVGGKFELLDLKLGPDGNKVRLLGSDNPTLPNLDAIELPSLDSAKLHGLPKLPGGNEYKLIEEYRRLVRRRDAITQEIDSQTTVAARNQLAREGSALRAARARILRRLNLTEEEARALLEGAEEKNKNKKEDQ